MYGFMNPDDIRRNLKKVGFKDEGLNKEIEATLNQRQQEKLDALALQAVQPQTPVSKVEAPKRAEPKAAPIAVINHNAMPIPPMIKPQVEADNNQPMPQARPQARGGKRGPALKLENKSKTYLPAQESVPVRMKENNAPVLKPSVNSIGGHDPQELQAAMEKIARRNMQK